MTDSQQAAIGVRDSEDARALLLRVGVKAIQKQAGYLPAKTDKPIIAEIVPYRRDWRKELFDAVHPVTITDLAQAHQRYMIKKLGVGFSITRSRAFVSAIVKQNRKFVKHDAA